MTHAAEIVNREEGGLNLHGGKLKVAVLGATGMVGQQLIELLAAHPWFQVVALAASTSSAGKLYEEAVQDRWGMEQRPPAYIAALKVRDVQDVEGIGSLVDVVFCAINLEKEGVLKLEHAYAKKGVWVTSNNSAYRPDPFVPMVAISGAGKTFASFPEIERNLIPSINGEEQKSEVEPLKIWGQAGPDGLCRPPVRKIEAKCVRVGVLHGHTAYVRVQFKSPPTESQILQRWENYAPPPLPSSPRKLIHYLSDPERPQPRLDAMTENGMAVSIGQLKVHRDQQVSFTGLSHNLILGAAGGAVLATEAAITRGLVYRRIKP
ncbi:MAG: aspartate-semialdehyde dehydrogenase [Acidobacteriota bacterium]|nr:aspartate-semialdehyde dehydrogenase [Acidobacteriota bacterium]